MISSLARTTDYQKQLIAAGYPAAPDSAHTKLVAFDIASKWFRDNQPFIAQILDQLLQRFFQEGRINLIDEKTIGAYHVARNPNFKPKSG